MPSVVDIGVIVIQALYIFLPAFLANMAPVFVGGGRPIDGGRTWKDGKPVLGPGKTWRGLLLSPVVATLFVVAIAFTLPDLIPAVAFDDWGGWPWMLLFSYALGLGALVGDAVKSFFKRRTARERGAPWPGFDQLDFVVGGLLFAFLASVVADAAGYDGNWFLTVFTWPRLVVLVVLTPGLHLLVNWIGYKIGAKDVPW